MNDEHQQTWWGIVERCERKVQVTVGSEPRRLAVLAVDRELRHLRARVRELEGGKAEAPPAPAAQPAAVQAQPAAPEYVPCTLIMPDGQVYRNKSVRALKLMPVDLALAKLRTGVAAWVAPADADQVIAGLAGKA